MILGFFIDQILGLNFFSFPKDSKIVNLQKIRNWMDKKCQISYCWRSPIRTINELPPGQALYFVVGSSV